jgi:hypothetical protein
MRFTSMTRLSLLAITLFLLFSCTKKTEIFESEALSDYMPLSTGKYITYRVDSTVFSNYQRLAEVHSYQVKNVIESQITDNLGRLSYRVFRYRSNINDTINPQVWIPDGTSFITPLADQIEVVEDNLRFIKMHLPIKEGFQWKGNRFLGSAPYSSIYSFSNDIDMENWNYSYENTNDVFKYNQQTLPNVLNIVQIDERFTLDTADVVGNTATIPENSDATYIRGNATDTIKITASKPTKPGHDNLTIYNQSNYIASLNKINIPAGLALRYDFYNESWNYPNPFDVVNNKVSISGTVFLAYIFGHATDSVKIDVSHLDTFNTKKITISNKSDFTAYLNGIDIPPNYYRIYELKDGQWTYYNNTNASYKNDPYIDDLPFGSTNYSVEKYAKNIGLVYKELIMWDYQPNTGGTTGGYKTGFGIKMWMIDHN